jgi:peptide/nickel transport system substrate-binding protein
VLHFAAGPSLESLELFPHRSNAMRIAVLSPLSRALIPAALTACAAFGVPAGAKPAAAEVTHAIAMHGKPLWADDFIAAPYANPDAPKGGRLVQGLLGTFDSLNPLIVRGLAVQAVRGYVIESLMARGYDEPFTLYGLLAQTVETDDARSYVTFSLDPAAHFSDGSPVTADDVIFSWQLLRDHGRPSHRAYYAKVAHAQALDPRTVRFDLGGSDDRELPLILGLMPVLPKHAIDAAKFEETTLAKPIGSGPYLVADIDPGRSVTFSDDPNYWGRALPINRGLWNFAELRFDYYRDANAYFEGIQGRSLRRPQRGSIRAAGRAATTFPPSATGALSKTRLPAVCPNSAPTSSSTRGGRSSPIVRVRQAIALLFDAEWVNRSYFFDLYRRSASFFDDSELSAIIAAPPMRASANCSSRLPAPCAPTCSKAPGRRRSPTAPAATVAILRDAHRSIRRRRLRAQRCNTCASAPAGKPFAFEIMVGNRDDERLALAFSSNLARAGIDARVRLLDAVQYDQRRLSFDFDMIENRWEQSLSPGNEQSLYWGSAAAGEQGSRNYMGVRSPAVDAMIAALLRARERADFVAAVRALDRLLISGCYVVPLFYLPQQWVARWAVYRPPGTNLTVRLPAGDVVARTEAVAAMILAIPQSRQPMVPTVWAA